MSDLNEAGNATAIAGGALLQAAQLVGDHKLDLEDMAAGRIRVLCSCGYVSAGRQNLVEALGAARHHLTKQVEYARRNGVSMRKVKKV